MLPILYPLAVAGDTSSSSTWLTLVATGAPVAIAVIATVLAFRRYSQNENDSERYLRRRIEELQYEDRHDTTTPEQRLLTTYWRHSESVFK